MVRIMQVDPKLGILQSLVVGMPSTSAFARVFQFGMRLGMRSYTLGSAWWQGDCGPYWGHNAVIRLAPFIAHCHIPPRPDGTHILSHDQIEAVLMRRAGYEVRVLPEEGASWEENPPIRRRPRSAAPRRAKCRCPRPSRARSSGSPRPPAARGFVRSPARPDRSRAAQSATAGSGRVPLVL